MSITTSDRERSISLGDKLRVEWPVLVVLISGLLYLMNALADIKSLLVGLDTRQKAIEQLVPTMQGQLNSYGERLNQHGERITRIEATQK